MCAPSPPATPDYAGAAAAQGAANLDAARATAKLSNPNIINPYGTQTVTYNDPNDPDLGTVTQTFSPEQQVLYEKNTQAKGLLSDLGIQGANALQGVVGQNLDMSGLPSAPGSADATRQGVINAMMSRVDEDTANTRDQANSDLIAAGIRPGTKAYSDRMAQIDRGYNDARQQAILAGGSEASRDYGMDMQSRIQAIAEILTQRQTPLNEINALMSGSQVSNPFAGGIGYQAGANVAAEPIFAATQAEGNAAQQNYAQNMGGYNNMMSGLFSIGSARAGRA